MIENIFGYMFWHRRPMWAVLKHLDKNYRMILEVKRHQARKLGQENYKILFRKEGNTVYVDQGTIDHRTNVVQLFRDLFIEWYYDEGPDGYSVYTSGYWSRRLGVAQYLIYNHMNSTIFRNDYRGYMLFKQEDLYSKIAEHILSCKKDEYDSVKPILALLDQIKEEKSHKKKYSKAK